MCEISVPLPGMESVPPAMEALSFNHWTAREVQALPLYEVKIYPLLNKMMGLKKQLFPTFTMLLLQPGLGTLTACLHDLTQVKVDGRRWAPDLPTWV